MTEPVIQSGVLKWFNTDDGYGFVRVHGLGKDALLHQSCVPEADLAALEKGAAVTFECSTGIDGRLSVLKILSIESPEFSWCNASVKWFNKLEGYGFVVVLREGKSVDAFVHASIANKLDCKLLPGTTVQIIPVAGLDGRLRAEAIRLLPVAVATPAAPAAAPAAG